LLPGPRWLVVPMANDPMGGVDGPIDGFSQCRPLPAVTIRGEATTGWAVKFESSRLAKIYISPKSGLPVRDVAEQEPSIVTFDFDYANVRAPAVK
jgi:hypothetical protein